MPRITKTVFPVSLKLIDAPTSVYYQFVSGNWTGVYRFQVIHWAAMRDAVPTFMDRMRMTILHWLGTVRIDTTVVVFLNGRVRHTTFLSFFRIPCLHSTEWFLLNDDGRTFTVQMTQRLAPWIWLDRAFPNGVGVVEDPDVGALYRLPWIGGEIEQYARRVPSGIELCQNGTWFNGKAYLRRVIEQPELCGGGARDRA